MNIRSENRRLPDKGDISRDGEYPLRESVLYRIPLEPTSFRRGDFPFFHFRGAPSDSAAARENFPARHKLEIRGVPVSSQAQSLADVDLRRVAQIVSRRAYIGQRVPHVAGPEVAVNRLGLRRLRIMARGLVAQ